MELTNKDILDDDLTLDSIRRRKLLPIWIKVFIWLFMVTGVAVPIILYIGVINGVADLGIYGWNTQKPFSLVGIFVMMIFASKAIIAYGLWTEKQWAVYAAIADAIVGIVVCGLATFGIPFSQTESVTFYFRFELLFLIPYLIKMNSIKTKWFALKER